MSEYYFSVKGGAEIQVDACIYDQIYNQELIWIGGRVGAIVDNVFVDLASYIAGKGAVVYNGQLDLRISNLYKYTPELITDKNSTCRIEFSLAPAGPQLPLRSFPTETVSNEKAETFILDKGKTPFIAYDFSATCPNIIVDSYANEKTRVTLSHWPSNDTPKKLRSSISTASVFLYLKNFDYHLKEDFCISTDHYDIDGLVSIYSIMKPQMALKFRSLLIDVAVLGDFLKGENSLAFKIASCLQSVSNKNLYVLPDNPKVKHVECIKRGLELLDNVLDHDADMNRYASIWKGDLELYIYTNEAFINGKIKMVENVDTGVALFNISQTSVLGLDFNNNLNLDRYYNYSSVSFHNRTDCDTLVVAFDNYISVYQRYESWVDMCGEWSYQRRDLSGFASLLNQIEPNQEVTWSYRGVTNICPEVYSNSRSLIDADKVFQMLVIYIKFMPSAWKP